MTETMAGEKKGNKPAINLIGSVVADPPSSKAILVDFGTGQAWIPRSQILKKKCLPDGTVELRLPEWLCKAKNLI